MGEEADSFAPASLLEALNRHHVAYVLIGGVAARAHGATLRPGPSWDLCLCGSRIERVEPRLGVGRGLLQFPVGT